MYKRYQYNRILNEINNFKSQDLYLNGGNIEIIYFKNNEIYIQFKFPQPPKITLPSLNSDTENIIYDYLKCDNIINFTIYFNNYPLFEPNINILYVNTYYKNEILKKIKDFLKNYKKYWQCSILLEKFLLCFYSHINIF